MKKLLLLVSIIFITTVTFSQLFYPKLQAISTPDFGQSDSWNLNIPVKFFLAENLKNNKLPLWNPYIGTGFPALAEGQTGTFFLPNLILLKTLPFPLAYNSLIVVAFLTNILGTYLFIRQHTFSKFTSLTTALIFSLSGYFTTHLTHLNLLQASTLATLILFLAIKTYYNPHPWATFFILALSQQIFTGFPQLTFITLLWVFFYITSLHFFSHEKNMKLKITGLIKTGSYFLLLTTIAFILAGIQLVPQYEFFKIATRGFLSGESASYFSYPLSHLATFVKPFFLGDPRIGSYPHFQEFDGSIFWENTGFFGIVGISLSLIGLFIKHKYRKLLLASLFLSFLLMLGKHSPFYFLFAIPPFSLFRVPSRFIIIFVLTLCLFAGITIEKIYLFLSKLKERFLKIPLQILLCIAVSYNLFDIITFYQSYHLLTDWNSLFARPKLAESINPHSDTRVYFLMPYDAWNEILLHEGWENKEEAYLNFRNTLSPNLNVLYKIKQLDVYPVQMTQRFDYFKSLIVSGITENENRIEISTSSSKLLEYTNTGILTSTKPISVREHMQSAISTLDNSHNHFYLYQLPEGNNNYQIVRSLKTAKTVEQYYQIIRNPDFDIDQQAIIENEVPILTETNNGTHKDQVIPLTSTNTSYSFKVNLASPALFILKESYYPGWNVYINGSKDKNIPVNLNSQGILLEKGESQIDFRYQPASFKKGILLTSAGIFIAFLHWFALAKANLRKFSSPRYSSPDL